jgi:hypothetical protein
MSGGYAVASTMSKRPRRIPRITGSNRLGRVHPIQTTELKKMKMTLKQRIRNWLMNDNDEECYTIEQDSTGPDLNAQSFRLSVYGASGGTIIETTKYDRKSDENRHSLHIVTEDKDLGEELAKIITMEQLR